MGGQERHPLPSEQLQLAMAVKGQCLQPPVPTCRHQSVFSVTITGSCSLSFCWAIVSGRPRKPENMACCTARFPMAAAAFLAHIINHPGRWRHQAEAVLVQARLRLHKTEIGRALSPGSASLHTGNLSLLWTWKSRNTIYFGGGEGTQELLPLQRSWRLCSPALAHRAILPSGTRNKTPGSWSKYVYTAFTGTWTQTLASKCHTRRHSMGLVFPGRKATRVVQDIWSQLYCTG